MKTFKHFLEEAANAITRFGSSNHQLKRKGIPHPDYPDMPHIYRWIYGIQKKAKLSDKDKNDYDKYNDPVKPKDPPIDPYAIPVKKA